MILGMLAFAEIGFANTIYTGNRRKIEHRVDSITNGYLCVIKVDDAPYITKDFASFSDAGAWCAQTAGDIQFKI